MAGLPTTHVHTSNHGRGKATLFFFVACLVGPACRERCQTISLVSLLFSSIFQRKQQQYSFADLSRWHRVSAIACVDDHNTAIVRESHRRPPLSVADLARKLLVIRIVTIRFDVWIRNHGALQMKATVQMTNKNRFETFALASMRIELPVTDVNQRIDWIRFVHSQSELCVEHDNRRAPTAASLSEGDVQPNTSPAESCVQRATMTQKERESRVDVSERGAKEQATQHRRTGLACGTTSDGNAPSSWARAACNEAANWTVDTSANRCDA